MNIAFAVVCSYVLGAVPTAYLFGKYLKGIDIRQHGSGNVGATNAFRILGKGPGTVVLFLDIIKGVLAVTVIGNIFQVDLILLRILLGVVAVIGHNWTVFLNFRGGKGIATSLGVLIGLAVQYEALRVVLLATILAWAVVFLTSGYVSLASIVAAVVLPVTMVLTRQAFEFIGLGVVLCVFVVYRHIKNIQRLICGQEHRVKFPFHLSRGKRP